MSERIDPARISGHGFCPLCGFGVRKDEKTEGDIRVVYYSCKTQVVFTRTGTNYRVDYRPNCEIHGTKLFE